jgi:RHS repeat-associated protein
MTLKKYFMPNVYQHVLRVVVLCYCLCWHGATYAQSKPIEEAQFSIPLKGIADMPAPTPSLRLEVTTPNIYTALDYNVLPQLSAQVNKEITNVITFEINEETNKFIPQSFSAQVQILIEYGHSAAGPLNSVTKTLVVNYDAAASAKFNAKQYYSFSGAEYVKVSLQAITAPVLGNLDTRDVLQLKNEMKIKRYFALSSSAITPTLFNHTTPAAGATADQLTVNWQWPQHTGQNGTQVEWSWIENETEAQYFTNGNLDYNLVFKTASRVDLQHTSTSYAIPLLYDGMGKLYYRIRPINVQLNGGRLDGAWSTVNNFVFEGHNNALNWQATTSYAEEGKRKTVIQYFDGSLRGRQTVTKDNATNTVVVAETMYDGEGRAAIQILPTPTMGSIIQYQAGLNRFNTQLPNQDPAEIFDMQPIASIGMQTEPLQTSNGSSQYYSQQNPLSQTSFNKNIPDAEGYPYTVTRFMPDATGRIQAQSGVGAAHKMGSGHETKYYYGGPKEEELHGLFGTEVGDVSHYSKNLVIDANGQASISYVDMHGRTIATALAGDAPACVEPLDKNNPANYPGQAGTEITSNLLNVNTNIVANDKIESVSSLLVPVNTLHTFTYSLAADKLQIENCPAQSPPANLCYDCKYDLEFKIVDETGEDATPVKTVRKYSNISLTQPLNDLCTNVNQFQIVAGSDALASDIVGNTISFSLPLPRGSYSVRKTLSLSQSSYQTYLNLYKSKALCKTEQQIIDSVRNVLLTTSNCNNQVPLTCENCATQLGDLATYQANYLQAAGITLANASPQLLNEILVAYQAEQKNCERLCNNVSQTLASIRELMLMDMIPFAGQYATNAPYAHIVQDPSNPISTAGIPQAMFEKYNIFFTPNMPNATPKYKQPKKDGVTPGTSADSYYLMQTGEVDEVIHPEVPLANPVNYSSNTFLNSRTPQQFMELFNPSWAKNLIQHHPEYQRLIFAENNLQTSYNFANGMQELNTYPNATPAQAQYLDPIANDPFVPIHDANPSTGYFNTQVNNSYQGTNISMWKIAYGDVKCKSITDLQQRQTCYINSGTLNTTSSSPQVLFANFTQEEKNQAWNAFKGLYIGLRNEKLNKYIAEQKPLSPTTDEAALLAERYRIWFPSSNQQLASQGGISWWPSPTAPPGTGPTTIPPTPANGSYCDSYIETWKAKLLLCEALNNHPNSASIVTTITNRMKAVCQNGQNEANPYGSSTVKPSTPANVTDRSFEQIIKEVFLTNGIINANGIYNDNYCNPFVIDWPKPYGQGPQMTATPPATQLGSCNCDQYSIVKTEAQQQGVDINNLTAFNVFLQANHGTTLTQTMFNALNVACGGQNNPACVCKDLDSTITLYYQQYPNGGFDTCITTPAYLAVTSRSNNTPQQYTATNTVEVLPNFDHPVGDDYVIFIDSTGACDSITVCQNNFVNFFNNHYGYNPPLTWYQIDSLYWVNCGHSINLCGIKDYNWSALATTLCNYLNYQLIPLRQSNNTQTNNTICDVTPFVNYFNDSYNNVPPLTWPQIVNIYVANFNSGGSGWVIANSTQLEEFVCGLIKPAFCLDTLIPASCASNLPYTLNPPEPLPNFLQCGYVPQIACISCKKMSEYTAEYKTIFSTPPSQAPIFVGTNLTTAEAAHNANYARFINYRTGFSYNWQQYAQAAANAAPSCNLQNYASNNTALQNVICRNSSILTQPSPTPPVDPCQAVYQMAINIGQQVYQIQLQTKLEEFEKAYKAKCLNVLGNEQFTVKYDLSEYHYTLYYYDQAGNLVKTVPPKGVRPDFTAANHNAVVAAKAAGTELPRPHEFITQYRYNSLNQVVAQQTPDAGISKFWYDELGRLVVSQNAEQALHNKYSYTLYDALGRIREVGQKPQTTAMTQTLSQNYTNLAAWLSDANFVKEQITRTTYDEVAANVNPVPLAQQNLRNRVSFTQIFDTDPGINIFDHKAATYYSYDIHGNVDKLLQDLKGIPEMVNTGNQFKLMVYDYDLISGKVNQVSYQPAEADAFYHKYNYDAENRLTQVYTSRDKLVWQQDATYDYYKHGPLARVKLGQQQVQGIDYAYTVQGWLKGINNSSLNPATDVFADGAANSQVAKDALSFTLHYYDETVSGQTFSDYKPIGTTTSVPYQPYASVLPGINALGLYNGNIKAMSVNSYGLTLAGNTNNNTMPLFYAYKYDQLNRIRNMQAYQGLNPATNSWSPVPMDAYKEAITYDPNGNILSYNRNGADGGNRPKHMDDLGYEYITNTNKLKRVSDNPAYSGYYAEDVDNQTDASNYEYDAIGNLVKDKAEGIGTATQNGIEWNVYGKIVKITKTNGTIINYSYDASGNRISKRVETPSAGTKLTSYVRDASGNVMAVYENISETIKQTEVHLYGSSRLGILGELTQAPTAPEILAPGFGNANISTFTRAEKIFELTNHLGNVLVTVSDKKIPVDITPADGIVDYFMADVVTASDYAPFGALLPGRKYLAPNANKPRYGFNGKENDNDVKGDGNQQDYGMRIYDPRLGKFLSVDPITADYPFLTPYQFASNRPIDGIDLDGLEYFSSKEHGGKGLYSLLKFRIDNNYTWGEVHIRNSAVHAIVRNHPEQKRSDDRMKRLPADDDGTPSVTMVKKRASSGRAQAVEKNETMRARGADGASVIVGAIDLIDFAYTKNYEHKHKKDIDYALSSLKALDKAEKLVRAANNSSSFPTQIKNNSQFLRDLANFITDGTMPDASMGMSYNNLVGLWGNLIWKNRDLVLNDQMNFAPKKTRIVTQTGLSDMRRSFIVNTNDLNQNPDVQAANAALPSDANGVPREQAQIKPGG